MFLSRHVFEGEAHGMQCVTEASCGPDPFSDCLPGQGRGFVLQCAPIITSTITLASQQGREDSLSPLSGSC